MRRCIAAGCTNPATKRSRCPAHQLRAKYSGDWPARSRAAIAAHIATHGLSCPGWGNRPPHQSNDLTLDHDGIVLCRACNTSKRRTGGG